MEQERTEGGRGWRRVEGGGGGRWERGEGLAKTVVVDKRCEVQPGSPGCRRGEVRIGEKR